MNDITFQQIVESKPKSSYSKQVLDEIRAISLNKDDWDIRGSFTYRASKYPADIDIANILVECCDKESSVRIFIKKLQTVVSNSLRPNHWFLELKAGTDSRFDLKINQPTDKGVFTIAPNILPYLTQLHAQQLISDNEYKIIYDITRKAFGTDLEYEVLTNILRNHKTLRWSAEEVLYAYKVLPGGIGLNLFDAVMESKIINIELIEVIGNKFTEISNFFFLLYYSPNGTIHSINAPQESYDNFPEFYRKELKENIHKLYYTKLEINFLKLAKRYFSYGRFFKNQQLVRAVYPLLNSNMGLAGQVKSELVTIEKLVENVPFDTIPINVLHDHLESIKGRLANILEIPLNILDSFNIGINEIIDQHYLTPDFILQRISPVKKYLGELTNEYSLNYLSKVNLIPPPPEFDIN